MEAGAESSGTKWSKRRLLSTAAEIDPARLA
jgi:hypothetical protein